MLRRLLKEKTGNFGIISALVMVPIIGAAGLAIDLTEAMFAKNQLQAAADAAALGAIAEESAATAKARTTSGNGSIEEGIKEAEDIFSAQLSAMTGFELKSSSADVVRQDDQLTATFTYSATVPTTLLRVLGKHEIVVSGEAVAVFATPKFRDFFLLLDNTPSMGVAATPADIKKMKEKTAGTEMGSCAFACHIVKNGVEDKNSNYNIAKNNDITIRINVVAKATAALMETAAQTRKVPDQYRMALYTFGQRAENTKLFEVSPLTYDLRDARDRAAMIDLMSIPEQNFNNDQQTDFDRAFKNIAEKMGVAGTGHSNGDREKVLFFVSDGLGNSYKPKECTKRIMTGKTYGRCQEPIDTRLCKPLKDKGYKIAVLYTTYLPLPGNSFYEAWIQPFQSEISTRMKECATEGYYFEVNPSEGIAEAMNTLFLKIASAPRLAS